jgi:hypothetical protein
MLLEGVGQANSNMVDKRLNKKEMGAWSTKNKSPVMSVLTWFLSYLSISPIIPSASSLR